MKKDFTLLGTVQLEADIRALLGRLTLAVDCPLLSKVAICSRHSSMHLCNARAIPKIHIYFSLSLPVLWKCLRFFALSPWKSCSSYLVTQTKPNVVGTMLIKNLNRSAFNGEILEIEFTRYPTGIVQYANHQKIPIPITCVLSCRIFL